LIVKGTIGATGFERTAVSQTKGKYIHEGLELAALVVRLSTFLGLPLGLATGAMVITQGQNGITDGDCYTITM
jgi:ABC-type dipeptide/oligopeptide/nickel transport system permease component